MKVILAALFALILFSAAHAAQTTLIAPYTCGTNMTQTCVGALATVVTADSNDVPSGVVFLQVAVSGATNRTNIYFKNLTTGSIKLMASDFQSALLATYDYTLTDLRKLLDAFYDSNSGKIFFIYSSSGNQGTQGTFQMTQTSSFDVSTGSTASISTTSINCGTIGVVAITPYGLAIYQLNSTHYYSAFSYRRFCAAAESGSYLLNEYSIPGASLIRTSSAISGVTVSSTPAYLRSMFISGNMTNFRAVNVTLGSSSGSNVLLIHANFSNFGGTGTSTTIVTGGGTRTGAQFFDNNTFVYTSSQDGNDELYTANVTGGVGTRRTSTSNNEVQIGNFNGSDKTQYFSYYIAETNTSYYDVYCLITNSYGYTCLGTSGSGAVFCDYGYYRNETTNSCVQLPSFVDAIKPTQMIVYDHACGENLAVNPDIRENGKQVVFDECGQTFSLINPVEVYDYVYVRYLIDNSYAAPAGYNFTSNASNNLIAANASCSICLTSDLNDCVLPSFNSAIGAEPNKPFFSAELRSTVPWAGKQVTVTCDSDIPNTQVSNQFVVRNTVRRFELDTLEAGYAGAYTMQSNLNESPISVRKVIRTSNVGNTSHINYFNAQTLYGDAGNTICLATMSRQGVNILDGSPLRYTTISQQPGYAEVRMSRPEVGTQNAIFGNYKLSSNCYSTAIISDPYAGRSPSITTMTNYQIIDRCSEVGYFNATPVLNLRKRAGNVTNLFQGGENVYVDVAYLFNGNPYDKGQCSMTLINESNSEIIEFQRVLNHVAGGPYSTVLYSDPNSPDPFNPNYISTSQYYSLSNGTYRVNVSCFNTDTSICILPRSLSKTFTYNQTNDCAGTPDACTLNACGACSTTVVTCENGRQKNLQDQCVSRECVPFGATSTGACEGEKLYDIVEDVTPTHMACGTDDFKVNFKLLKNGVPLPPATIEDLACTLTIAPTSGQVVDLSNAFISKYSTQTGAYWSFDMKNNFERYRLDYCGSEFTAITECYSKNFTSVKKSEARFFVGSQGNDCRSGDSIVKEAQCLYSVSGADTDKPLLCLGGQLQENSGVCGCPVGMSVNSTTNGCNGTKAFSSVWSFTNLKWLSLGLLLFVLLLGPHIKSWYDSIFRKNNYVVNLPPRQEGKRR